MVVYRITVKEYRKDISGTGAMLYGGRWNSKGRRLLYSASSLSLAALETAVNLPPGAIRKDFYCIEIALNNSLSIEEPTGLPRDWKSYPYSPYTVEIGDDFLKRGGFCLKVPSAVIETEYNYLINPEHPAFDQVHLQDIRPFIFDRRLALFRTDH